LRRSASAEPAASKHRCHGWTAGHELAAAGVGRPIMTYGRRSSFPLQRRASHAQSAGFALTSVGVICTSALCCALSRSTTTPAFCSAQQGIYAPEFTSDRALCRRMTVPEEYNSRVCGISLTFVDLHVSIGHVWIGSKIVRALFVTRRRKWRVCGILLTLWVLHDHD